MGYLETEIARCERRIKNITERPDPKQLRANALLYEIQRDLLQEELDAVNGGKPFAFTHGGPGLDFLFQAMGIVPFHLIGAADRVDRKAASYFQAVRGAGYPSTICDRFQMALGLVLTGDVPKPQVVVAYQACDVEVFSNMAVAHLWGIPYYFIDFRYNTDTSIDHFVDQLGEVIEFAEKHVPGAKYDEAKLEEYLDRRRQAHKYLHQVGQMMKHIPAPISGRDVFRIIGPRLVLHHKAVDYFRALSEEVQERVEKGIYPVPNEKLRIMWAVTGPYFLDVFKVLEKHDASVPIFLWSNTPETYGLAGTEFWDVSENIGRKATPLEEVSEGLLTTWFRTADLWAREVVEQCRNMSIDGIVYYQLSGCPSCRGAAKMVADAAEEQLDIPMLPLEGWMVDAEKFDPVLTEEKLEEFVAVCSGRKEARGA